MPNCEARRAWLRTFLMAMKKKPLRNSLRGKKGGHSSSAWIRRFNWLVQSHHDCSLEKCPIGVVSRASCETSTAARCAVCRAKLLFRLAVLRLCYSYVERCHSCGQTHVLTWSNRRMGGATINRSRATERRHQTAGHSFMLPVNR